MFGLSSVPKILFSFLTRVVEHDSSLEFWRVPAKELLDFSIVYQCASEVRNRKCR